MADLTPANDIGPAVKVPGAKRRKSRNVLLKLCLALTIIGPLIFIVAALGAKLGLWGWQFGLLTLSFKIGPLVLIIGAIISLLALLTATLVNPRKGIVIALIGLIVPGLAFGKLMQTKGKAAKLPFIHDVTTDTQNPPVFGETVMAERLAIEGVNTTDYAGKTAPIFEDEKPVGEKLVSVLQTNAFPEIRPLVLGEPQDVIFGKALATAQAMGWDIKEEDMEAGRIDATDTTFWYGFEDDVAIRLRPSEGGGTIVDVRSLSRIGGSDLGKNAARVGEFLERLGE